MFSVSRYLINCDMKKIFLYILTVIICANGLYLLSEYLLENEEETSWSSSEDHELSSIFLDLDVDKNGLLSFSEFAKLTHYKIGLKDSSLGQEIYDYEDIPFEPGEVNVTLKAHFSPLNLSSLSKDLQTASVSEIDPFYGLLNWVKPFRPEANFSAKAFSVFMPPENHPPTAGYSWWVVKPRPEKNVGQFLSNRYYPPKAENRFRPLFAFLQMFHPRPFLWTRFTPQGTVAVLRAVGKTFFDIIFRVHAEFQLNKPPLFPFWFTPGQFSGRLVISKDAKTVYYFHMEVPNHRKLNVDMEWLNGPSENTMEVDIGYLPEMSLKSQTQMLAQVEENLIYNKSEDVISVTIQEAMDTAERMFFPFKEVKYYNFSEALTIAKHEDKLMHGIILWGALDDQSC